MCCLDLRTRLLIRARLPRAIPAAQSGSLIRLLLLALICSLVYLTGCSETRIDVPRPAKLQLAPNTLLFAGDVMFCRAVRRRMLAQHDPALPFRALAPELAAADITF